MVTMVLLMWNSHVQHRLKYFSARDGGLGPAGLFAIFMVSSDQRDYFFLPAMAFAGPLQYVR